jgi:diguanylate cyclase (GGDEF)-like protein
MGEGPCLAAYEAGEAVAVPELRNDLRFPRFGPPALHAGLAAVFTFPLRHGDHRLGALDLYRDTIGDLSPRDMSGAQTLADVAAAYLLISQARTALQQTSAQNRAAALHDPLTGLPNRVLLLERLEQAFVRAQRSGHTVAVLFIDLDQFKAVNDNYGHRVGDELLMAVAERLTGLLRSNDTLARLYGDEFVVLCEDLTTAAQLDAIVARLEAALAAPFVLSGTDVDIAASVGIAFSGRSADDPQQLIHDADVAMYRAKRDGRGRNRIVDLRDHMPDDTLDQ